MLKLRKSKERGQANFGWLDSKHSFSFGSYYDPRHMGVSALRVINDDWVDPGTGFDTHPHRDMEIISYVLEGSIEHKDTAGHHSVLTAGEVQLMSAGKGIFHSEYNTSNTDALHFLQIWIEPNENRLPPSYQQRDFGDKKGVTLIVSPDGRKDSLKINQNASMYQIKGDSEFQTEIPLDRSRTYYLHLARGELKLGQDELAAGDGATLREEEMVKLSAEEEFEALLFELP